jgi:hypothetical protein
MKPVGNISQYIDLTKPQSAEAIRSAIRKAQAAQSPISVRDAAKAGYGLELIAAHPVARACATYMGRQIRPLPRFVKE